MEQEVASIHVHRLPRARSGSRESGQSFSGMLSIINEIQQIIVNPQDIGQ